MGHQLDQIFRRLCEPFGDDERTRRGGRAGDLKYITARAVMNRLDSVLGPWNWWDGYDVIDKETVVCRLSIRLPDGQVITKCDSGEPGEAEASHGSKAIFSDSFKRAAVKFGIGRYLYGDGVPDFCYQDELVEKAIADVVPPAPPPQRTMTRAPEQSSFSKPWEIRPTLGTKGVWHWIQDLGQHFNTNIHFRIKSVCQESGYPERYEQWDAEQLADMVHRVVEYCKKLKTYKGEFGELQETTNGTPHVEKKTRPQPGQIVGLCYVRASMLASLNSAGGNTDQMIDDIIHAHSGGMISGAANLHSCTNHAVLESTLEGIERDLKESRERSEVRLSNSD